MSALAPAADLALSRELSPPFSYAAADAPGLVTIFFFEDVAVTAYNGAIPLLTSKAVADTATAVALIEAYHAGIVGALFPLPHVIVGICMFPTHWSV